jgi:hypothetical protein
MIQRIQSIFLLLNALLGVYVLFWGGPFYTAVQGNRNASVDFMSVDINGVRVNDIVSLLLLAGLTFIAAASIFLYQNRPLQIKACWLGTGLSLLLGLMAFLRYRSVMSQLGEGGPVEGSLGLSFAAPFLMIAFFLLALRGIMKDEALIKGMDRLR